ncbi:MAG: M28 family peptidase [Victivallales bacterium]|nr:M28 family peptidase [Victivallales bacterium]
MKQIYQNFLDYVDENKLYRETEKLWMLELPQTSKAFANSAAYCYELLKKSGFLQCEVINFPADGKTSYQDKRMPLAWNASSGKLTITQSKIVFDDPVIADYHRHPFSLIRGSVALPGGNTNVRIITEHQMNSGTSAKGTLVLCEADTNPGNGILATVLDKGALGIISGADYRDDTSDPFIIEKISHPAVNDAIYWINNCTEGNNWHVQIDDRPFVGFSISPRTGGKLREACNQGEVCAFIECDGIRSEGVLPAVTGIIPGKSPQELWILAHLYEPLSDDNSTGVAGTIEISRTIQRMIADKIIPEQEFTIRVVFTSEVYGYAAFAERNKKFLKDNAIGAINIDSMISGNPGQRLHVMLSPPPTPFWGNYLLENLVEECSGKNNIATLHENGGYGDDTFLNDPTIGLPTVWMLGKHKKYWHNSKLTMETIDIGTLKRACALAGTWIASVITLNKTMTPNAVRKAYSIGYSHLHKEYRRIITDIETARYSVLSDSMKNIRERMEYQLKTEQNRMISFQTVDPDIDMSEYLTLLKKETEILISNLEKMSLEISGSHNNEDENLVRSLSKHFYTRETTGFPFDLIKIPKHMRKPLPDNMIYGSFARILSNMDGTKSLLRLLQEAEWEEHDVFTHERIKEYTQAIEYLTKYGYLKTLSACL